MEIPKGAPGEGVESVDVLDPTSEKEEFALSSKHQRIQAQRHSDFKQHVHWTKILALYIACGFYFAALFTWLYHLLIPEMWHYMPEKNYLTLQNMLFGSIIGGVLNEAARKIFSD